MTTKKARDYLDKELFVKRGIVTFRSLSRELGIHVNDAKKELQFYYDAARDTDAPAVPTYLVSGEVEALTLRPFSESQQSESAMDIDLEFEEDSKEMDVVHRSKVLLVDARALDDAKSQFSRIHSVHIYSLSPSRFGDAGLVCIPSYKVRQADAKGGPEYFSVVGKITGSHVKLRAGSVHQSAASSSKSTLDVPVKVAPKLAAPIKAEQQTMKGKALSAEMKEQSSTKAPLLKTVSSDKPKPSRNLLDWSKAKTKEKVPPAERTKEKKPKIEPDSPVSSSVLSGDAHKRGTKRKPPVKIDPEFDSGSSSAEAKPSVAVGSSVKKGVVYSDEDDDDVRIPGKRRPKKKSTVVSDSEMSLRAMMDIDDEQIDRVSRVRKVLPQREEVEESEEEGDELEKEATLPPVTTEDEESDHMPVIPKRRRPRKVVPTGRNGLKKRRVIKSRMTTDAKGYMQTEDYSSYESVEEEEETKPKPKPRGKERETKKASESTDNDEPETKPKVVAKGEGKPKAKPLPKSRGRAPKRGGLLNFFGPERGKK